MSGAAESADYRAFQVAVSGGQLFGGQWRGRPVSRPPAESGRPVAVLTIHGITASHRSFSWLATALPGHRVIAPDLRGRARSNSLPGPYALRAQADDMVAVLDGLGVERVIVVGHSMGAFVAVWLAHRFPDRVDSLVLVDGGLPIARQPGVEPISMLGPAAARLSTTFANSADYTEFWRRHPAFADDWSPGVADFARYDLDGAPFALRPSTRLEAVGENVLQLDGADGYAEALASVTAPIDFLRAPRGLLNEPAALYDPSVVAAVRERLPALRVHEIDDVNHYTIVMSAHGAERVASVITAPDRTEPARTAPVGTAPSH
ncbi:alpha/beta fold hydrolase [Cryobacterium frigoriphilum]|uniref:Alpha/beta fold hydrolase n=1 Tax=Cryobacterium frigoriphilum TaxID=1259150 RepID=A0A4R8ZYI2_9MICO|nr:alpha/beta fold hydrolase [Cryobacterium frigoriphilum]TFD48862.1 alpha/beta fold hydrolase [Cryobacterium frigoriphilum]